MSKTTAQDSPPHKMTVEEFLGWAMQQHGRYELIDGVPVAMSPERSGHARTKYRVAKALENAIAVAGIDCEMLPDGMTVKVHDYLTYEPDVLVYCGKKIDDESVVVPDPVIIVEVLSPGTRSVDFGGKLEGYFMIESLQHYLIVNPVSRSVTHHKRGVADLIETRVINEGTLALKPPGLALELTDFFG